MKRPTLYLFPAGMSLIVGCLWLSKAGRPGQSWGWLGALWIVVGVIWIVNYAVRRKKADASPPGRIP